MSGRARRGPLFWLALVVLLLTSCLAAIAIGTIPFSPATVLDALRGVGEPTALTVVRDLRLPRMVLAALVGAGLAMSGAALQGTLRNALAEPYLLGVSGGAAVGAVIVVAAGATSAAFVPIAAFAGAVAAVGVALMVARAVGGRADPRVLLMAGVVVGAFANAAIMIVLSNASADTVRNATWWMMGSVAGAEWRSVRWLALYVGIAAVALLAVARDIDVLSLGEESAAALGVRVERSTRLVYLLSALIAAATVSAAGLVGFVGLMVPHLARAAGVRTHRALLVACALGGAALVVGADTVARVARPPGELPLGAVTAVLGVPFFLARLRTLA